MNSNCQKKPSKLDSLLQQVRACRACEMDLPLGPRPVLRVRSSARLLIAGQAPGTKVHATGIPWNDPSGDRLRMWMGVNRETFYDETRIAILPMGLCYPGRNPRGGDLPPRTECAHLWFDQLWEHLPNVELLILVGQYSQRYYLGERAKTTLTATVRSWQEYAPRYIPLPHPSFRNNLWIRQNPWFEAEVVQDLRERVNALLKE